MNITQALYRLGRITRNARDSLGYSQRQFAKLFGTSHPSISNLENGNYINLPDHSTLIRLSQILRIPYWQLIRSIEEDKDIPAAKPVSQDELVAIINSLEDFDRVLDLYPVLAKKSQELRP